MQTFLPYQSFTQSAHCLDRQRLGKQRIETLTILRTLRSKTKQGWSNHPAVKMWRGYEGALQEYGYAICNEWRRRGYKDSVFFKLNRFRRQKLSRAHPKWLSDRFCQAHQSNLLRKDPKYYGQFGWGVGPNLPYVWPI